MVLDAKGYIRDRETVKRRLMSLEPDAHKLEQRVRETVCIKELESYLQENHRKSKL